MRNNVCRRIISAVALACMLAACGTNEKEEEIMTDNDSTMVIQQVETENGEMRYFRFGNENGKKMVLLPGLSLKSVMGSADLIAKAYGILADDYDVYVFDRLTVFPEGYTVENMAEDTLYALKQLGISSAALMGVSQGGMISQYMAVRDPEMITGIILCSTAPKIGEQTAEVFAEWKKLAQEQDAKGLAESFGSHVYTPSVYEANKAAIAAMNDGASEQEYRNFVISVEGTMNFDFTPHLKDIHCPAYVIGAGEDKVLGAEGSKVLMKELGCDGYIYEGRGHGVYDEDPEYLSRVRAFLDQYAR